MQAYYPHYICFTFPHLLPTGLDTSRAHTLPASPASRPKGEGDTALRRQGQLLPRPNTASSTPDDQHHLAGFNSLPAMKLTSIVSSPSLRLPMPIPSEDIKDFLPKQQGTEQMELLEEDCPIPLSDVAKLHSSKLPQLFRAKENHRGLPAIKEGDILLVQYKKTVKVAHGRNSCGDRITLAHNCKLLLTDLETKESRELTAKSLLSSKSLPPAMIVMKQFAHVKRQIFIQSGTILLNIHIKRDSRLHNVIVAEDTTGQSVEITANCPGVFSVHPQDIQLHLVQLLHSCKLPIKVYLEGSVTKAITLHEIDQQEVLVIQPLSKDNFDVVSTEEIYELPADSSLRVVKVVGLANKCEAAKIQYYSMFRKLEGDDDTWLYDSLREPTAVRWRSVPETHSDARKQRPFSAAFPSTTAGASASLDSSESVENNIAYLKRLTVDEVLELLEAMQLEEYQESFKKERIDGEMLSSLTEADLMHELNIQKRLHRVRLMKVIEGVYSVQATFHELYI